MAEITELTSQQKILHDKMLEEAMYYGTCTERADRPKTEYAIKEMYRLIGKNVPNFIWVDGPASGFILLEILKSRSLLESSLKPSLGLLLELSLESPLVSSLESSLGPSLGPSLRSSIGSSLEASLRSSIGSSLEASLWSSLGSPIVSSLESSLRSSLESSLWSFLGSSLWSSLKSLLRSSLGSSLWSSLRSSLWSSLRSSLRSSLWSSLWSSLESSFELSLTSAFWGQHSLAWITFYQFCGKLGNFYSTSNQYWLQLWTDIGHACNWWFPYENVVICCERPTICKINSRRVLHCDDGPAMVFGDGWKLWVIDGILLPQNSGEKIILRPQDQTLEEINAEVSEEVRRIRIERYGWLRYITESNAGVVDYRFNDIDGTQECLVVTPDGYKRMILACRSSGRKYAVGVPDEIQTTLEGQKWLSSGSWLVDKIRVISAS